MTASQPSSADARLATLERHVARLRVLAWLGVVIGAGSLGWVFATADPPVREGRLWLIRDERGRVRAQLGVSSDGVGLTMYDSAGKLRLDVGVAPGGVPGLVLVSPEGVPVATMNASSSGPTLRLVGAADTMRVELAPRATPLQVLRGGRVDSQVVR